jgi:L-amino acid N-acyltransferase YncA
MTELCVRPAGETDLEAINEIYNYYVPRSTCTYQLEPEPIEVRIAWFRKHSPDAYPVVVVEEDGKVLGWGSLSRFRERAAYDPTVEASIYVHHEHHRRGIGRMILIDLIAWARKAGFHSLIGGTSADQTASIALQRSLGFQQVALFREVGLKFGRRLDVVFLQLMLNPELEQGDEVEQVNR